MPTARRSSTSLRATAGTPSVRYVETSALLAGLLERDAHARRAMRAGALVTSALTFTEARRALVRARKDERITARQERAALRALAGFSARCTVVGVTSEVLATAGQPFPAEPVRTLDAIHLATIAAVSDAPQFTTVITRDHRVRANAEALGYAIE